MKFDILTLFPEMLESIFNCSIIGRARKENLIEINCINIRDYAGNKHNRVDDYPYGGGKGMVMQAEPIYSAFKSICDNLDYKPKTIYLSPQGKPFRQSTAKKFAKEEHLILLCGHYEGIDQRVLDEIVDEEISIGDFVLTGGELGAAIVVDATSRLIKGVLSEDVCFEEESHYNGLLEYPQYTRPSIWNDKKVPEILQSGHHDNIRKWKREQSILNTFKKRRGLLRTAKLTDSERSMVENLKKEQQKS